ncbi:MAG: hypothetical protein U0169_02100 [Polyangiaceae bacterium]
MAKKKSKPGDCFSSTEAPQAAAARRIDGHLYAALGPDPRQAVMRLAHRARLLAGLLVEHAVLLERLDQEAGVVGPVLRAAIERSLPGTERINAAWRAFFGLTEERHKRLALIESIEAACEDERVMASHSTAAERTDVAKSLYALNFPEAASQLDGKKLERAVTLWSRKAGRRPGKVSKWSAIADLMADAGLGGGTVASIRREWTRFADEVRASGEISGTKNR